MQSAFASDVPPNFKIFICDVLFQHTLRLFVIRLEVGLERQSASGGRDAKCLRFFKRLSLKSDRPVSVFEQNRTLELRDSARFAQTSRIMLVQLTRTV